VIVIRGTPLADLRAVAIACDARRAQGQYRRAEGGFSERP